MTAPAPTRAEDGRYTVVYKGDPSGNRILNGEPAVGRAVGVMLGDLIERAAHAEAEVAWLRERVATLEAALQPFANYAADMPGADFGEGEIGEYYHDGFRRSIRTQDLRAARTALEAPHADK